MRWCVFFLFPLLAAAVTPGRYARVGDFDGQVEVQLTGADDWMPAERNLPLPEGAWIRTGPSSRVEIELDEGSVWRLGPESQGGLADYTRHATGQRVTLLALDHGLAYFTGAAGAPDSLLLVVPGAQVTVTKQARLRFEAAGDATQLAVLEGIARFASPAAEIDVARGQTSRVEPARPGRFFLYRQIAPIDLDAWSASRDKALATAVAPLHVGQRYGLADLDAAGQWIQTDDLDVVWQPKSAEGWTPYRSGHWRWLEGLGYTWISAETWGWLPYHYGRWTRHGDLGWVWAPVSNGIFKPAEVFWMRGPKFAAWGPLAPGENWDPKNLPAQWGAGNTTFAAFAPEARLLDPETFKDTPKEPLKVGTFVEALPSPAFAAARLDAVRPVIPVNALRVTPVETEAAASATPPPPRPAVVVTQPAPPPPPQEIEVPVPVPVIAGFFVVTEPPPPARNSKQPSESSKPAPKPVTIPPFAMQGPQHPAPRPRDSREAGLSGRFDLDFSQGHWEKSLAALDEWTNMYPETKLATRRFYDYLQAHSALGRPDDVLQDAARLMTDRASLANDLDERQRLVLLYLTAVNAQALPKPTREQRSLGAAAAQSLLDMLPTYSAEYRRPSGSDPTQWWQAWRNVDGTARNALVQLHGRPRGR